MQQQKLLQSLKDKEDVTLDGRKIRLYANIGSLSDIAAVFLNDAGGIGLFRSEFIYLGRKSLPTEEEQFQRYLEALVLECNLIKEHRPKYNTMLKDDKSYPFIKVTVNEPYPRVLS